MIRTRSARALAGGLSIVFLLVVASTAWAVVTGSFSGKTGQKQSISFHVGHGKVTNLDFHIRDTCPSGHAYAIRDFNFPAIKINKSHKFDQAVPRRPTAESRGRDHRHRRPKQVKGTLFELRHIPKENGRLRWAYEVHGPQAVGDSANRRLHHGGSFARPARRYYDAGSERMACGPPKHQQIL